MAQLMEIKSRWDGKCSECGRELKQGWTIFYDKDTKNTFCTVCAKGKSNGAGDSVDLSEVKEFTGTCGMCSRYFENESCFIDLNTGDVFCQECGKLKKSDKSGILQVERKLEQLENQLDKIAGNGVVLNDIVAGLDGITSELNKKVDSLLNEIAIISVKLLKPAKEEKEEKEKQK